MRTVPTEKKRSKIMKVYLTKGESDTVRENAIRADLSLSDYVRQQALHNSIQGNAELQTELLKIRMANAGINEAGQILKKALESKSDSQINAALHKVRLAMDRFENALHGETVRSCQV